MTADWHFRKIQPGETAIEPTQGQFFNQDVLSESAVRALVREGIQNAIDARVSPQTQVRIRVALMRKGLTCKRTLADRVFTPVLWEHIKADENGLLQDMVPKDGAPCDYLVFEDFGTIGLTGDIEHHARTTDGGNNFFNFFRAIGSTDKRGNKLGKWGVGKHTFWMASSINTVFGYTIRASDEPENKPNAILMGKTILKSHAYGGGKFLEYRDGYYGKKRANSEFVLPLSEDDGGAVSQFMDAFKLHRTTEPGLSLVVPWISSAIKRKEFVAGVAEDYFYPILTGRLAVNVATGDRDNHITPENLEDVAATPGAKRLIKLAQWMQSTEERCVIQPASLTVPEWSQDMFSDGMLSQLSESFRNNCNIALRVKVEVSPKQGHTRESHFDIALTRTDDDEDIAIAPCFVRDGIIIPRVRPRALKNIVAIVVAENSVLADFLGASENPSHTEWQKGLLRGKYRNYASMLNFVCDSVNSVVRFITSADKQKDRTVLADIFPMPEDMRGDDEPPPPPPPPPQPRKIILQQIDEGFSVRDNPKNPLSPGAVLKVEVAYLTRRGNPISKYEEDDFLLENLNVDSSGMSAPGFHGNKIRAEITSPKFSLRVSGFDGNRDLYVKADAVDKQKGWS